MADIGWITGHTYIVYGPLLTSVSTTIFESTPVYPKPSRYWETVAKHKLTHFYSAPYGYRVIEEIRSSTCRRLLILFVHPYTH
ncbi:hypothetical protein MPER_04627 [Moniliophthora perniciosa FA553]|nr:hypothetical protein MPER_04627 [Moniliophthora perniciosa FA553]